jgi:hypothetical protein
MVGYKLRFAWHSEGCLENGIRNCAFPMVFISTRLSMNGIDWLVAGLPRTAALKSLRGRSISLRMRQPNVPLQKILSRKRSAAMATKRLLLCICREDNQRNTDDFIRLPTYVFANDD